jgi:DNA-binding CsgD family transcriptional regulator
MGEAGVGKTRLARELARRSADLGATVMWGSCPQVELSLPFVPFLEAIGNYLSSADLPWVKRRLGPLVADLADLFPALGPASPPSPDPAQSRVRLFEALAVLLRVTARRSGLLLVIDDLHWADATTREVVDFVARRLRGERALIVAGCRPEALHGDDPLALSMTGWVRSDLATKVELTPLGPLDVDQMVSAMLPGRPISAHLRDLIYERSEGNPYVVEELVGTMLNLGEPRAAAGALDLPQTVRDMVLQRVRKLSEPQRRVLGLAATLGKAFDQTTLFALAGGDEEELDATLVACRRLQLLDAEPGRGDRYHFRHELTRRVVYEELPRSTRKRLHQRAADVLRELSDTPAVDLAYHLLRADAGDAAVPFCIKAAEEAQRRRGYHEAADLYERVLPLIGDNWVRGQVEGSLGYVHLLQRDPGRAVGHLAEGIRILEAAGQSVGAARYHLALGRCHWERSRPDLARSEYEAVRVALEPHGASEELAQAYVLLSGLADFDHDHARALELGRLAVNTAIDARAAAALHSANTRIGSALANLGQVNEGLEYLDRAYADALAEQFYSNAESALYNSIVIRWQNGLAREALALVPRLRELQGERSQDLASFTEGTLLLLLGELAPAERALTAALLRAEQAELSTLVRWIRIRLAWLHAVRGRPDLAVRALPGREVHREQQEMLALRAIAIRVLLDAGDVPAALVEADATIEPTDWGATPLKRWLFDAAVEALIAGRRVDDARQLAAQTEGDPDPYQSRMEGRIALADGRLGDAAKKLSDAAEMFSGLGYAVEEHPTRLDLARALSRAGRRRAAAVELNKVIEWASGQGANRDVSIANRLLARLGAVAKPASPARPGGLSRREWEIAALVAGGLSNRAIAERLSISERTVEGHVERIRNRLRCRSRAQIASWFTRQTAVSGYAPDLKLVEGAVAERSS